VRRLGWWFDQEHGPVRTLGRAGDRGRIAPNPVALVRLLATLAVIFYLVPALVILALVVGLVRMSLARTGEQHRRLGLTQAVALWFAFVLAPGCAGVALISQYPICLG
jgi:hypothetical protein